MGAIVPDLSRPVKSAYTRRPTRVSPYVGTCEALTFLYTEVKSPFPYG